MKNVFVCKSRENTRELSTSPGPETVTSIIILQTCPELEMDGEVPRV